VLIRDLKGSDVLGDQRDRQALVDQFASDAGAGDAAHQEQRRQILHVLEAEIKELHARYLERRGAVCAAANRIVADLERPLVSASALAAAGVFAVAAPGSCGVDGRLTVRHRRASAQATTRPACRSAWQCRS